MRRYLAFALRDPIIIPIPNPTSAVPASTTQRGMVSDAPSIEISVLSLLDAMKTSNTTMRIPAPIWRPLGLDRTT